MKLRDMKIGLQLNIGLSLILLLVLASGALTWVQMQQLWGQTEGLYNHPLAVRRALGRIEVDVEYIRTGGRDLFLAQNETEIEANLIKSAADQADIERQITILYDCYLGPQSDIDNLQQELNQWKLTREETIRLLRDGKRLEAAERIKIGGAQEIQFELVKSHIQTIDSFSLAKGDQFYQTASEHYVTATVLSVVIYVVILLLSIVVSVYMQRGIQNPLTHLNMVIEQFKKGAMNARSQYHSANEFGALSDAINSMADAIETQMQTSDNIADLAAVMLRDEEAHTFCRELLGALLKHTRSQVGAIYFLNDARTTYEHFESIGLSAAGRTSFSSTVTEGEIGLAVVTRCVEHIRAIPTDTRFAFAAVSGDFLPREILTIPILSDHTVVAVISLASLQVYDALSVRLINDILSVLTARINGIIAYRKVTELAEILEHQTVELGLQKGVLAKSFAYNRSLIEASIDSFMTLGLDGIITDVNHTTEEVTGLLREELVGTDFANYFTEPERAKTSYQQVFREGLVRDYELAIRHTSGQITPVLFNAAVYRDETGAVVGVFGAARDISERKQAEQELTRINQELTLKSQNLAAANAELDSQKNELQTQTFELSQQNTELKMQKQELDDANALKNTFVSNMSHELRTPLNSVIALAGVLSRRLAKTIPPEEQSFLEIIERNGRNLLAIINDILDLSRIEAGHEDMNFSRFSMRDLVDEIVAVLAPQAQAKGIELNNLVPDDLPAIVSDTTKCLHILQNIVANAVKFTDLGHVTIGAQQDGNEVYITVTDTGIGMSTEQLPYIFDEFRQGDYSTSRKYGGTGLGLAIARKYALLIGGSISVTSTVGAGSVFTLRLPINYESAPTTEPAATITQQAKHRAAPVLLPSGHDKLILVVEDNESAVIQLYDILSTEGYRIEVARNGQEALERLETMLPDAIILDLMMPLVDGFQVLEKIRSVARTASIPVLILTARHVTKQELSFLKSNHIHELINKGAVNRIELLNTVAGMVTPPAQAPSTNSRRHHHPDHPGKPLVLVVEDNLDNLQTARVLLRDHFQVIEATDGQAGVEQARTHKPDLILMDIALPVMDGFGTLAAIRGMKELDHIPVVAVTASAMKGSREEILASGFDDYVSKPVDSDILLKTIRNLLELD